MSSGVTERFAHVEIEINSTCDMGCPNCDRFIDVAPTRPMTVAQVRRFVAESLDLEWAWDRIHILGGEPTLHHHLREIVEALIEYRDQYPQCLLRLISNGGGHLPEHVEWLRAHGVKVNVESKARHTDPPYFQNMRRAPLDFGHPEVGPCSLFGIYGCGVGFTRHGFFLCGAGASVARVAGLDVGAQHLADMTYDRGLEQAQVLCRLCGHHESCAVVAKEQPGRSPFWERTLKAYENNPPILTVYGSGR